MSSCRTHVSCTCYRCNCQGCTPTSTETGSNMKRGTQRALTCWEEIPVESKKCACRLQTSPPQPNPPRHVYGAVSGSLASQVRDARADSRPASFSSSMPAVEVILPSSPPFPLVARVQRGGLTCGQRVAAGRGLAPSVCGPGV